MHQILRPWQTCYSVLWFEDKRIPCISACRRAFAGQSKTRDSHAPALHSEPEFRIPWSARSMQGTV